MALSPEVLTSLEPRFEKAMRPWRPLNKAALPMLTSNGRWAITGCAPSWYRLAAFTQGVLGGSITTAAGQTFTDMVWIGIGGSGLEPLLIVHALQQTGAGLRFHFIDNVDSEGMGHPFGELGERLKTSLVIVVSKSGSTPESHMGMVATRRRLEHLGGSGQGRLWPSRSRVASWINRPRKAGCNVFVTFIEVLKDPTPGSTPGSTTVAAGDGPGDVLDGFLQGTRSALTEGGRQSITITMKRLGPRELGALVALFERAVGFYGELVNVNAYHQPGVEAGKKAAAAVLSLQKQVAALLDTTPRTAAEIAQAVGAPEQVERVFWILRHMTLNRPTLRVDGPWGDPRTLRFFKG